MRNNDVLDSLLEIKEDIEHHYIGNKIYPDETLNNLGIVVQVINDIIFLGIPFNEVQSVMLKYKAVEPMFVRTDKRYWMWLDIVCPCCGNILDCYIIVCPDRNWKEKIRWEELSKQKYCYNCGQHFKWEYERSK